ncbi:MAG: transposase [Gemmataceae bacterium]
MSLLEHAQAQALLADAEVTPAAVRSCLGRLRLFLARYLRCFPRSEQRELAEVVLSGKLSGLQRKTAEPIAYLADRPRKPVQHFVGAGAWDDDALLAELRRHVAEVVADPEGVLALDGSGFAKKGEASCGVQRQSCGRLGQVENCQVGLFLAYVAAGGAGRLVDRRLYLPEGWANDPDRRGQTHVPRGGGVPGGVADRPGPDRPGAGRPAVRLGGRRRRVRPGHRVPGRAAAAGAPLRAGRAVQHPGEGHRRGAPAGSRCPPWRRVDEWARRLPASRWRRVEVGPGSKGPQVVRAAEGGCRPGGRAAGWGRWSGWW